MAINKQQFLDRLKERSGFKTVEVDVPDFGVVTLRQMDSLQQMELAELRRTALKEAEGQDPGKIREVESILGLACLSYSLIDPETREPMFTAQEAKDIFMQMSQAQLTVLLEEFGKLNFVKPETAEKNSETSTNIDSASA